MVSQYIPVTATKMSLTETRSDESATDKTSTVEYIDYEDPLAAARGVVNGVLLSVIIWVLIAMIWLVL